ncbi:hypothetical protein ScPMuIL_003449 [Solemya velum]
MNFFLLLVVLVLAYGIEVNYKLSTTEQKQIYGKCRDDLSKCRKSSRRSPKIYVHWAHLVMCHFDFHNCVSVIPPSILDGLK